MTSGSPGRAPLTLSTTSCNTNDVKATRFSALIPMMAGAGNNVDIGALASQAVGGGVAGAIVAGVVGLIKNKMAS